MTTSTLTVSVETLEVLAAIIADETTVCMNTVHHNGYDDSDFCDVVLNLATRKIYEVCTHSTRGAGYKASGAVAVTSYSEEVQQALYAEFKSVAREVAEQHYKENNIKHAGDTLIVSNPKARKHKGEVFVCTGFSSFNDTYGRVQTRYVHGEGVKTNTNNCTIVAVNPSVLDDAWQDLFLGVKL